MKNHKLFLLSGCFIRTFLCILPFIPNHISAQPSNHEEQIFEGAGENNITEERNKASTDLALIKSRILKDLMEPAVNEAEIKKLITTIKPDGSWPGINYVDTSRTGFQHKDYLQNMLDIGRAFKKPGTQFFKNADVRKTVSLALNFWIEHDFICENWWWNEMGTPNLMINTLLVLGDDLLPMQQKEGLRIAGRASFTGFGARAGGDFVPIAGMVCKQALFKEDEAMLMNAIKVMGDQIVVTTDRGIKPDLSFHHRVDNVISIHTYGTNYVSAFTYWSVKTAGTTFKLSGEALKLLIDYYLDGICKAMAYQKFPDVGAKNRDLSRKGALHPAGTEIPENFILSTEYRKKELENIIAIRKGNKKNDLTWNQYFWHSSYFTHQRNNYFASVRMHSSRQRNMEDPYNEEGLRMHHLADGGNFISRTGQEYADVFAVWNWQKIPGTTVVQKPVLPPFKEVSKKGKSDFVGAVTDGQYGAAAFDFASVHDSLTARKSWFFFNDEYVCLGAGINSNATHPVATTLNQCLLNSSVELKSSTGKQTLQKGEHKVQGVSYVYHDSIGYIFNEPAEVHLTNTTATGNYRQINHQEWATEEPVYKDLFTLWVNHGASPKNASYAYTVLPGIKSSFLDAYLRKSAIIIIANTPEMQAVQNKDLQLTQVVFYQPGTIKINNIINLTSNSACMVMVKLNGSKVEKISVADPTQKLNTLQLKINLPVIASGANWKAEWNNKNRWSDVQVNLPAKEMAGKSVVMDARGEK